MKELIILLVLFFVILISMNAYILAVFNEKRVYAAASMVILLASISSFWTLLTNILV